MRPFTGRHVLEGRRAAAEAWPRHIAAVAPAALVALATTLPGQAPELALLRDLDPRASSEVRSSSPQALTVAGNEVWLRAARAGLGVEPWRYDPASGTVELVGDLSALGSSNPNEFVAFAGLVFFGADDGVHGRELWASDGTAAGTRLVADIAPGASGSEPRSMVIAGSLLFFVATDGAHGRELWATDGTTAGTRMVADVNPGPQSGLLAEQLVGLGNVCIFAGYDPATRSQLWRSDGTNAGTHVVVVIDPWDSVPGQFARGDNLVYFSAYRTDLGHELWVTDGTAAGTHLVVDVAAGLQSGYRVPLATFGNVLLFSGASGSQAELWRTDGSAANTYVVRPISRGGPEVRSGRVPRLGNRILFQGVTAAAGAEPWISDGTEAGTYLLADLEYGPRDSTPVGIVATGAAFYFRVLSPAGAWRSDGTTRGTTEFMPLQLVPTAGAFTAVPGRDEIVFSAGDAAHGTELWTSDGTAAGTRLLADLNPNGRTQSSLPTEFTDVLGTTYFVADDAIHGRQVWRTDGSASGTTLVVDFLPGTALPGGLTAFGDRLVFGANESFATRRVWISDGTAAGTVPVSLPNQNVAALDDAGRGRIVYHSTLPVETWISDGTSAGSQFLLAAQAARVVARLASGEFLLAGSSPTGSAGMWRSDGTAAGTRLVYQPYVSALPWGVGLGSTAFFTFPIFERRLWRNDSTGTAVVSGGAVDDLFATHRVVFFCEAGQTGADAAKVWALGEQGAAVLLATLPVGAHGRVLGALDGLVVFAANAAPATGADASAWTLWRTDGTAAGTAPFASGGGTAHRRGRLGADELLFSVEGDVREELWRTDGEAASPIASVPLPLVAGVDGAVPMTTGRLLFGFDDGEHGEEPWTLFPGASAQPIARGCGGVPAPALTSAAPRLGTTVDVRGVDAATGAVLWALVVAPPPVQPWLFDRAAGCGAVVDLVRPWLVQVSARTTGTWTLPVPVPNTPVLDGLHVRLQYALAPGSGPGHLDWSNGLGWTFGR